MTVRIREGQRIWSAVRDSEGHRTYKVVFLVEADRTDGPANVLQTPGLPVPGAWWIIANDVDLWAWCRPDATVASLGPENQPTQLWNVECVFSTKPPDQGKPNSGSSGQRCNDAQVEDPLLEPMKISGSFTRFQEEAFRDRFGFPVVNSAWEQMRGPQVEFDRNRPTVKIEQNVASLGLEVFSSMVDSVNDAPLWNMPRRCVKLSNVTWDRKYYGQCFPYYTRTFEFELNWDTFDRNLLDEGTKVLQGHWDKTSGNYILDKIGGANPNRFNPQHFMRFQDRKGNVTRVILNGAGLPIDATIGSGQTGPFYVSKVDSNFAHPVTNSSFWIPIVGSTTPAAWDITTAYVTGNLVASGGSVYIATSDNTGDIPPSGNWLFISTGSALVDKGVWSGSATYSHGDIVRPPSTNSTTGGPGNIHLEKYPEANFLLLGIPTTL